MRFVLVVLFALVLVAQNSSRRPNEQAPTLYVPPAPQQTAQDITLHVSADLATALENLRRHDLVQIPNPATGGVDFIPRNKTISDEVDWVLRNTSQGLFRLVIQQFPPDSVKVVQDAADKAASDAETARQKSLAK